MNRSNDDDEIRMVDRGHCIQQNQILLLVEVSMVLVVIVVELTLVTKMTEISAPATNSNQTPKQELMMKQ